jgi:hypothetical protein
MASKLDRKDLELILRNRGRAQTPQVIAAASEIRSCLVAGNPETLPPPRVDGLLGGCVIMWDYRIQLDRVQGFRSFLSDTEERIRENLSKASDDARYLGTYMRHAGGTPRFRTLWAYTSQEHMADVWKQVLDKNPALAKDVIALRAYWLLDPDRTEARWIAARRTPNHDYRDAFYELTLRAAQRLANGGQPSVKKRSSSAAKAARKRTR